LPVYHKNKKVHSLLSGLNGISTITKISAIFIVVFIPWEESTLGREYLKKNILRKTP